MSSQVQFIVFICLKWMCMLWYWMKIVFGVIVVVVVVVVIIGLFMLWFFVMVICVVFIKGGDEIVVEMDKYVFEMKFDVWKDVVYGDSGVDIMMDVFCLVFVFGFFLMVVWIYGGVWIFGVKENVDLYMWIFVVEGYMIIVVNYMIGLEGVYLFVVYQFDVVFVYIDEYVVELGVDVSWIVLVGDFVGVQFVSQMVMFIMSFDYVDIMGIVLLLKFDQFVVIVFNCGVYDLVVFVEFDGIFGWGFKLVMWVYLGIKMWVEDLIGVMMLMIDWVMVDFFVIYIFGGNGDGFIWLQFIFLVKCFDQFGVDVMMFFWFVFYEFVFLYEYQFYLDMLDVCIVLQKIIDFFNVYIVFDIF